jgi:hypothetical protein
LSAIVEPPGSFENIKDRSTAGVTVDRVVDAVKMTLADHFTTAARQSPS